MERVLPPRPSNDGALETIEPLPSAHSLSVLLDVVRSPGILRTDVDALVQGLARPLAEDETPRARADFLLSVIDAEDVGDLQGSGGSTVRAAAVQALLAMGYPYALELPPEALTEIRGSSEQPGDVTLPLPGLIATLAGFLTQFVQAGFPALSSARTPIDMIAPGLLLIPAPLAVLAGLLRMRSLLKAGVFMMGATGIIWLLIFLMTLFLQAHPFSKAFTYVSLVAGLGFLLGSILLRPNAWLGEEKAPKTEPAPPTET